ncbi:HIT family protein [Tistrella mobilis]|uniref:HIT domain-containing protein n=1 Tax=Tistrella mobilis TaxID=171437 RepID=A0A162KQ77_9PROT|nr:HIT family protein [Tistrella mobilis]KYO51857.1 hypothetical protein AUP44_06485 [Tistrella mobilis]
MSKCPFCMIATHELPSEIIHEDEHVVAFMDVNPIADGHVLVIPRRHAENLHAIDPEDLQRVVVTAKRIAAVVQSELRPDGINLFQANGRGAGQTVFHLHMHVLPRSIDDGMPMSWDHKPGDRARIAEVAGILRSALARSETGIDMAEPVA